VDICVYVCACVCVCMYVCVCVCVCGACVTWNPPVCFVRLGVPEVMVPVLRC
jgi:hypothetical protein